MKGITEIRVEQWPLLNQLYIRGQRKRPLTRAEAFGVYETEWHHGQPEIMTGEEWALLFSLIKTEGEGFFFPSHSGWQGSRRTMDFPYPRPPGFDHRTARPEDYRLKIPDLEAARAKRAARSRPKK